MPHFLEKYILSEVLWLLRILKNHGKLDFERINVSPTIVGSGRYKRYAPNPMRGWADIVIWIGGRTLWFELKSDIGKQSPEQKIFQQRMEKLGHHYFIVKKLVEAQAILRSFNIEC
jgi:hypothetical protein